MTEEELDSIMLDAWGSDRRVWYIYDPVLNGPLKEVRIGTGGCGKQHVVHGTGKTLEEAMRNAGLIE